MRVHRGDGHAGTLDESGQLQTATHEPSRVRLTPYSDVEPNKYLYCIEDTNRRIMKVGLSTRPRERILALRHDVPSLHLQFKEAGFLWICFATQADENRVHRQLGPFRIREKEAPGRICEWYRHDEAVLNAVKAVGPMIVVRDTPARHLWTGRRFRTGAFRERDWRLIYDAVSASRKIPEERKQFTLSEIRRVLRSPESICAQLSSKDDPKPNRE
jgi:hypothetical protein